MSLTRALGLMSGTSMDGVDVALIETDGAGRVVFGPFASFAYSDEDRALLRAALADAAALTDRTARPGALAEAERLVTERHAEAVAAFLRAQSIRPETLDVIGFHGQTVLHKPDQRLTVQIGDGAALARACGVDVVFDMRAADVAAGGQGAPLVPVFHQALARAAGLAGPVVVANIGGVANITSLAPGRDPLAGDTGPGNALLDDLMLERTGVAIDRDGACAARGHVNDAALAALTAHAFFAAPLPKSLDRNAFSRAAVAGLATEDAAATLTAFTAETYRLIETHGEPLPEAFAPVFARMAAQDWLASYRDSSSVALALGRMAQYRLRQPNPLAGAGEELLQEYAGLETDFLAFLPDALAFAEQVRRAR